MATKRKREQSIEEQVDDLYRVVVEQPLSWRHLLDATFRLTSGGSWVLKETDKTCPPTLKATLTRLLESDKTIQIVVLYRRKPLEIENWKGPLAGWFDWARDEKRDLALKLRETDAKLLLRAWNVSLNWKHFDMHFKFDLKRETPEEVQIQRRCEMKTFLMALERTNQLPTDLTHECTLFGPEGVQKWYSIGNI